MSSMSGRRVVGEAALLARLLMFGVLVAACGGGGSESAPTPTPQAKIAVFAGRLPNITEGAGDIGGSGSQDGLGPEARFNGPSGLALDRAGNVYVADEFNHTVRKITPAGVVSTLAGSAGLNGSADGSGADARFHYPSGVATDSAGNVYVADRYNGRIRKITPAGFVSTLVTGLAEPVGIASDSAGNLYVACWDNTIRKVTPAGVVSRMGSDNAKFLRPSGIATDGTGNVYVGDTRTIRKITPDGVVTTLAGSTDATGSTDGSGASARFDDATGVATDSAGKVFVADFRNHTIRQITPDGVVTTLAGSAGIEGSADGNGADARFSWPRGVATDGAGNVYVADSANDAIRKITPAGLVSTLAGSPALTGSEDGSGADARFYFPSGLAVDGTGQLYVADKYNHTVRRITPAGLVSTLAGSAGAFGTADGSATDARFHYPSAVAVDGAGNAYVVDTRNEKVRKITPDRTVSTLAGSGALGSSDGGGASASFNFCGPRMCFCDTNQCSVEQLVCFPVSCEESAPGLATDAEGNVYVADCSNHAVRKITPAGIVSTLAGSATASGSADGNGADARFSSPSGLAIDNAGNLYVADANNHTIRKISPAGVVSTIAGNAGVSGSVDGRGPDARFNRPRGIAVDSAGNVYVADYGNHTIRKVDTHGRVTTIAGVAGVKGFQAGELPGLLANPWGVAVTGRTLYVTLYNGVAAITNLP